MAYRSKYTGRYSGIGSMLGRLWLQAETVRAAERLRGIAESISPVGTPGEDKHPGQYKASFVTIPIFKNVPFKGKPRMRASARMMNTAPHASIVEHGNGRTPRYAVLSRTIDIGKERHRG
ncbi:hypothetical protein AB0A77_02130 [Streptomyces varsoviensis]|uniref:hypothetical protein n=1 Tax=Streptomyces varsoviensis TaxID=67373 RepID=UPI0033DC93D9